MILIYRYRSRLIRIEAQGRGQTMSQTLSRKLLFYSLSCVRALSVRTTTIINVNNQFMPSNKELAVLAILLHAVASLCSCSPYGSSPSWIFIHMSFDTRAASNTIKYTRYVKNAILLFEVECFFFYFFVLVSKGSDAGEDESLTANRVDNEMWH